MSAEGAIAKAPALARSNLSYAYVYGDSGTDDARLVLAIVQAARTFGALTLPHTEVTGFLRDDAGDVCGAYVHDHLTGEDREIRARHVVNATGVWVDQLLSMVEPTRSPAVQPSKGVHVVVPRERLPLEHASVLLPSRQGDSRSMFAIAWGPQTILGTTDTAYDGSLDALSLTAEDLDYVLAAGNAVFDRDLTADDVVGAWAGLRPLLRRRRRRRGRHPLRHVAPAHLAGRAGRARHDHRRQAHDLPPDGQRRRRRPGCARRPAGSMPHRRDCAREQPAVRPSAGDDRVGGRAARHRGADIQTARAAAG